jgi:hypothetical protein
MRIASLVAGHRAAAATRASGRTACPQAELDLCGSSGTPPMSASRTAHPLHQDHVEDWRRSLIRPGQLDQVSVTGISALGGWAVQ